MRKNQCAVVISHIRTSRRNVKTLPEATHDLAQRELSMLPLRAARIEAGNLPNGGHAIVVIRNDSHVQGARALRNLSQLSQHHLLEFGSCLRRVGVLVLMRSSRSLMRPSSICCLKRSEKCLPKNVLF
jgi:hypothetical protein